MTKLDLCMLKLIWIFLKFSYALLDTNVMLFKAYLILIYGCLLCCNICQYILHYYYRTTAVLWLSGFCLGQSGWAGTRRNIHPLTPVMVINYPLSASSIYYDPWHRPCSIYMPDSLFAQSLSKLFFGLPLGLAPSTSYFVHCFTQSLSSFHTTCRLTNCIRTLKANVIIVVDILAVSCGGTVINYQCALWD